MFSALLATLAADAATSVPDLAGVLGTDARTVRLVLEQCQRLGYLESVDAVAGADAGANPATNGAAATSACAGCPVSCPVRPDVATGACPVLPGRPTWWRLTERGERAVRAARPALRTI